MSTSKPEYVAALRRPRERQLGACERARIFWNPNVELAAAFAPVSVGRRALRDGAVCFAGACGAGQLALLKMKIPKRAIQNMTATRLKRKSILHLRLQMARSSHSRCPYLTRLGNRGTRISLACFIWTKSDSEPRYFIMFLPDQLPNMRPCFSPENTMLDSNCRISELAMRYA